MIQCTSQTISGNTHELLTKGYFGHFFTIIVIFSRCQIYPLSINKLKKTYAGNSNCESCLKKGNSDCNFKLIVNNWIQIKIHVMPHLSYGLNGVTKLRLSFIIGDIVIELFNLNLLLYLAIDLNIPLLPIARIFHLNPATIIYSWNYVQKNQKIPSCVYTFQLYRTLNLNQLFCQKMNKTNDFSVLFRTNQMNSHIQCFISWFKS